MSMRKFKVGMAAVLVLGIVALFFVVNAFAQSASERLNCPSGALSIFDVQEGINVECVNALFATLTLTADAPTDTPIPGPTDTPVPPTDTSVPSGHNANRWHPLTEAFEHEHGLNDPNSVNDIFGEPGCWYGECGQSIGYTFETPNENRDKHEIYTWLVARDLPSEGKEAWVKAFRWEAHFTGGVLGTAGNYFGGYLARFHSTMVEAQVCRVSDGACGIVRFAGHMDTGCLKIDGVFHCLPGEEDADGSNERKRDHRTTHGPTRNEVTWYATLGSVVFANAPLGRISVNLDILDGSLTIFPGDIFNPVYLCSEINPYNCEFNDSIMKLHQLSFRLDSRHDDNGDGLISLAGFTDQFGIYAPTCTEAGPNCVPYSIENAPAPNTAASNAKTRKGGGASDGDISPSGEFWIRHPN